MRKIETADAGRRQRLIRPGNQGGVGKKKGDECGSAGPGAWSAIRGASVFNSWAAPAARAP